MIGKVLGFVRWVALLNLILIYLFALPWARQQCQCGHERKFHPLFIRPCYKDGCMCRRFVGKE